MSKITVIIGCIFSYFYCFSSKKKASGVLNAGSEKTPQFIPCRGFTNPGLYYISSHVPIKDGNFC
jgi:hypothetical protein